MSTSRAPERQAVAGVTVRTARLEEAPAVAGAMVELLIELGAEPPPSSAIEATARELIQDARLGLVLVAISPDGLVGVLGASWQTAMHSAGRYCQLQDLWVRPDWRSRAVGAQLLSELAEQARGLGIERMEVGLPREGFPGLERTRAFYAANGFQALGPRMRARL